MGYHMIWQNPAASQWQITSMDMLYTAQRLVGVLLMLALAQRFLNHDHPKLALLNCAVFPFYLLHQSVIIGLAYYFSPLQLGPWLEPTLIILFTFGLCALVFRGLSYGALLRPLFGMKANYQHAKLKIAYLKRIDMLVGGVAILPMALRLLL